MIPKGEVWHYIAVKKLSALLRGIASMHDGSFYGVNCFHSLRTKSKLELHKKVCENKDFCNIVMPFESTKILEFNQYKKPDKAQFIIYADFGSLIKSGWM